MTKISIIGSGGAGKSTLAVRLGNRLNVPVYHLDALYWKPGWVEADHEAWVKLQVSMCKKESWIIDGNYGGTMDIRLKASDTVIFLDLNRYLCLLNVLKRNINYYGKTRPDMGAGCKERFDLKFAKWIHEYPIKKKPEILKKLSALKSGTDVYVLRNRQEIEEFLNQYPRAS